MIASISKVMTCLICIELIDEIECDPSDTYIQVNSRAAGVKGTTAKLKKSDIISVQDLLYGLMLPSGNNAAYSLAENFGEYLKERNMSQGDAFIAKKLKYKSHLEVFVNEMNKYASKFGMTNTIFSNPHGLTHNQNLSSVTDLALLSARAMKNEKFRKIVNTQNHISTIINGKLTRQVIYKNTNKVLGNGFIGLKTGTTAGAGNCVSLNFVNVKKDVDVIIILLNSPSDKERWADSIKLRNYIVEKLENGWVAPSQ